MQCSTLATVELREPQSANSFIEALEVPRSRLVRLWQLATLLPCNLRLRPVHAAVASCDLALMLVQERKVAKGATASSY